MAETCESAIGGAQVVLLAIPCEAHRKIMDLIAPLIRSGKTVIVSSHCSLGAIYLARFVARHVTAPIVALGSTVAYSRADGPAGVHIWLVRDRIECATLPPQRRRSASPSAIPVRQAIRRADGCDRGNAVQREWPGAFAMGLANLTRMERAERWHPFEYATESVSRFAMALDRERLTSRRRLLCRFRPCGVPAFH